MAGTFNASAQVLSIGIFFTLMILGRASKLPVSLYHGLTAQGGSPTVAVRFSHLPPVAVSSPSFLAITAWRFCSARPSWHTFPMPRGIPDEPAVLPAPHGPAFSEGLTEAFSFAAVVCVFGAVASLLRGDKFHYEKTDAEEALAAGNEPDRVSAAESVAEIEPLLVD